ncbi:hypothetical protein BH09BAC3_BH09BAC3_06840 [soil metagenome]
MKNEEFSMLHSTTNSGSRENRSATYTCPMHSEIKSDKPGKCPKCGMDLVKKS